MAQEHYFKHTDEIIDYYRPIYYASSWGYPLVFSTYYDDGHTNIIKEIIDQRLNED